MAGKKDVGSTLSDYIRIGGVTNGNDLMAAYARATKKYWPTDELVELGLSMTDVGDRSQFYCKI